MRKLRSAVATVVLLGGVVTCAAGDEGRVPVLLELFTSEGCSSCPPADRLLAILDQKQPAAGAELIVLSEHVDYWDRLGWRDRFSSPQYTARQQDYAARLHVDDVYTPQLVVDGRFGIVGNNDRDALAAIQKAIHDRKIPITIGSVARDGDRVLAHIAVSSVEPIGREKRATLFVALADDKAESQVTRGENAGHTLGHVAVARALKRVGTIDLTGTMEKDVALTAPAMAAASGSRLIVFIQDERSGHILGAALRRF